MPEHLSPGGAGPRELEKARLHYGKATPNEKAYQFSAYAADSVKYALEKLFHGKCAYCESRYDTVGPVDIEHHRPKGGVDGDETHPGYWWLAMAWENLLPSCIDCNRRRWHPALAFPATLETLLGSPRVEGRVKQGKENLFPIAGLRARTEACLLADEKPLLLDPCSDSPDEHLTYFVDHETPLGLALPVVSDGTASPRGVSSIYVYGLNRLALVQERTRLLRKLEFLIGLADELIGVADELRDAHTGHAKTARRIDFLVEKIMMEIRQMAAPEQPYSSLVKRWLSALGS